MSDSKFALLFLMAMGNWVNSHSPPLDTDAPSAKGNAGQLSLDIDGEQTTYSIESASISGDTLTIRGEAVGGKAQFHFSASLPNRAIEDGTLNAKALRGASLSITSGTVTVGEEEQSVSGSIKISSATGSGPWEIDGEVALTGAGQPLSGSLQARVT